MGDVGDLMNHMIQEKFSMTNINYEFTALAQQLKHSQLLTISIDAQLSSVYLEFVRYNDDVLKFRFSRVALFNLFKEVDEVDSFNIVDAKSEIAQGDIAELCQSLLYQSGQLRQILTDISIQPLYHLYLEGELSLDLVAAHYERIV